MENKKWYDNAVMVNRDACWAWVQFDRSSKEGCRKNLERIFSWYNGAVTDVLLGVFSSSAFVPNKHITFIGDNYHRTIENGIPVDNTKEEAVVCMHKCYGEFGIDAVQVFIDEMNKLGIRPWLNFRMNDSHFCYGPTSPFRSDIFYEALNSGHMFGDPYNRYDFRYTEYTDALLGYIEELLGRYDVFGIDLDFMRDIRAFDYDTIIDGHKYITELVRRVRDIANKAGERLGHDVKICLRTCRSPEDAFKFGYDVKTMADEGLVDVVAPSPYWVSTDSAIPVREWRALLGDKVGLICGLEQNSNDTFRNLPVSSKAYAAAFYAQGADGIYLNNHEWNNRYSLEAWKINRDTCLTGKREFIVTFQDTYFSKDNMYKPLPLKVDGTSELPLEIGKVKASDSVKVLIDFEGDEAPVLSVLGKEAVGEKTEPVLGISRHTGEEICCTPNNPLIYDISGISTDSPINLIFKGNGTVGYVNLLIDAK